MVIRPSVDPHLCFVLMPFNKNFDEYYKSVLKPTVESKNFNCIRADGIYGQEIMTDIWKSIWKAAVVIADVTTKNPNVNYELGLCHALGVPTVIITQNIKHVPFDYRHRRHILYRPKTARWKIKLKNDLSNCIDTALNDFNRDRLLVWPDGTRLDAPRPQRSRQEARSVVLDFARVPFRQGQNADFIRERLGGNSEGFSLRITPPKAGYWRAGFVLAPVDYIHEGRADIGITEYFLFHIASGVHSDPAVSTPISCIAYLRGRAEGPTEIQAGDPVDMTVSFGKGRDNLTINIGNFSYKATLDPEYLKYLYVLAWADKVGPFRIPVELRLH